MKKLLNLLAIFGLSTTSGSLIISCSTINTEDKTGTINKILDSTLTGKSVLTINELSSGAIIAGTSNNSIYKLTDEGKIDTSVGDGSGAIENNTFDGLVETITQLSNGTILAGTSAGSIYKLTDEGKIDTSVGDGTGKLESKAFNEGLIETLIQLSNGTILVGINKNTSGEIYKLTDEGKIDTSVGGGTGLIENNFKSGGIESISELSNGTILAGTNDKLLYVLKNDGTIDTSAGDGTGKIINKELTGWVNVIAETNNKALIVGTNYGNSIYRLNYDGTLAEKFGNGTGKIEDGTLEGNTAWITQLSSGIILLGTNEGLIYQLNN